MLDAAARDEDGGAGLPPLADADAARTAAPRHRLPLRRSGRPRGEDRSPASIASPHASYTVHSTIDPPLQRAVEEALQEGPVAIRAQHRPCPVRWRRGESLRRPSSRSRPTGKHTDTRPSWQQALANARLPLYDVHWTPAVVVERPGGKKGDAWRVGLADGRIVPLSDGRRGRSASSRSTTSSSSSVVEGKDKGRRAPSCGCVRRCRAWSSCWRTRPAASSRCRAASPIR